MNRGTFCGDIAEIELVKSFNLNKESDKFDEYLRNFKYDNNIDNVFMVRVTTKQYSKLSEQIVMTRADAYLIKSTDSRIYKTLENNSYYLDEEILKLENIKYEIIEFSGVSIKMSDSEKFQILKLTPNSFCKLFGEFELGAAASCYCKKEEELEKNELVCIGWNTSKRNLIDRYIQELPELGMLLNSELEISKKLMIYKKLKDFSNNRIKEIIDNDKYIQEIIFNGYHIYEEPYSASYFYKGEKINKLTYIPFWVTTGSGRSKGVYTIVLKPKNETI